MDTLKDGFGEYLYEPIMDCIPFQYDDDVFEFEIVIRKVKNISKKIGVDKEGVRTFTGVEVKEIK